jgi:outer membrane protein assembly factor BamB
MRVFGGAALAAVLAGCGGRTTADALDECASNGSCEPTGPAGVPSLDAGPDSAPPNVALDDAGSREASTLPGADAGDGSAPASSTDFTTFLANPAHTDSVDDGVLVPPLRRLWTVSLGQPVSYPLVVGDLVYVTASATQAAHARVLAFDRASGAPAWRADLGTASAGNLAYEGGRVFEVDTENTMGSPMLRAFDATGGALDWQVQADPNQPFYGSPPVAYDGTLYVTGAGTGGDLYAYDESQGAVSWAGLLYEGSAGAPAISADGVFVFGGCGETTAFGLAGGMVWQDRGECAYAASTPVLVEHALYEILPQGTNERVDTRTGETLGTFASDLPPAFGDGMEFDVVANVLRAVSTASGATAWTFSPDGGVVTSALVAGGTVYVGSSIGTVFALDAATGEVAWSENTGASFSDQALFGMAAAHGVLVVPAGNELIAYAPAGASFDAGVRQYGGPDARCPWTLVDGPVAPPAAHIPASMAVADLNGDGKDDILTVGSYSGGGVNVMLGAGDGTFDALPAAASFTAGGNAVAVADLDGDGWPDVVTASSYEIDDSPDNVSVSRGNGDGTLQPPTLYAVGTSPYAIALADLDADGRADLVVADGSGGVRVLLNHGDGTLAAPVAYGDGALLSVAVGDVDGDGKPDLVLAAYNPAALLVLLGKGDGTFAAPQSNALDQPPGAVALGDVNGDGAADLVVLTSDVEVLLGKGDGTFQTAASFQAGPGPSGVAIADVDRDGHPDLVVTNGGSTSVSILFGNGDGTFVGQVAFATGSAPLSPAIADFNGDGQPDVVTCNEDSDSISVLLGACGPSSQVSK